MSGTIRIGGQPFSIPEDIPVVRDILGIPGGECMGCYLGDAGPAMHDIPDACDYLGGYVYELPEDGAK